jgi:arylsulfatase A-like enzyme
MTGAALVRARLYAAVRFSAVAGLVLALAEALDRLKVLRPSIDGAADAARLAVLCGASVLLVTLVGTMLLAFLVGIETLRTAVRKRYSRLAPRWRGIATLATAALAGAAVARVQSLAAPWVIEGPVVRVIRRVDNKIRDLGLLGDHPKIVFTVLLILTVLALALFAAWLFSAPGRRGKLASASASAVLMLVVLAAYAADSRIEFTRYEAMFHVPLGIIYSAGAALAVTVAARAFGEVERIGRCGVVTVLTILAMSYGLASISYGAVAMDSSQNAKALFWGRSVLARRVLLAAKVLTDGDGDGFSDAFGGADADDTDPKVNPLAPEVPGNGRDDNCIGGDLAASSVPVGSLFGGEGPPTEQRPASYRNVVFIVVDALRADRLSCYGNTRITSPNIDAFAAGSLLFENAYAQGTNTGHSLTSAFRSSYGDDIFDDRIPSLAEVLSTRGYRVACLNAVRMDIWLNANRWQRYRALIDDVEALHTEGERVWNAEQLTDQAIATLDQSSGQPHFLWIHYFDTHQPRRVHPEFDYGRGAAAVFDSNVSYVDRAVGRLLDYLRATGRLADTAVIITADHGEAFGEHGATDHSNKPYLNNTLVPLIVRVPGGPTGRFVEPCGLVDVAPTVLAWTDTPVPPAYRGIDLAAAARLGSMPRRCIVSETPRNLIESSFYTWAMVRWPYKIMWDLRSNAWELYDIETDRDEVHNLTDRRPELADEMRQALGAWLDRETARTGGRGPTDSELSD